MANPHFPSPLVFTKPFIRHLQKFRKMINSAKIYGECLIDEADKKLTNVPIETIDRELLHYKLLNDNIESLEVILTLLATHTPKIPSIADIGPQHSEQQISPKYLKSPRKFQKDFVPSYRTSRKDGKRDGNSF